ncbi:MAG: ABC transporter ATP-binding protein [marine bacterium B5-7]|nr:MAG: ABC transporter ATP-binding protein [marine bacterium B5-7]
MKYLLEARSLVAGYGELTILNGCDITVEPGSISVIVGANGAGKSTAMKAVFGLLEVRQGSVKFEDQDVTGCTPQRLVELGMGYVPQVANVFPSLSVEENLEMGAYLAASLTEEGLDRVYSIFPILKDKRKQAAGQLSGGQRQMVAVGRAMMMKPRLLMLDEPTAGVSPKVMGDIFEIILKVNESSVGVLMVEQNARQALAIADTGFVLQTGQNLYTDTGEALLANPEVARSFLGGKH